MRIIRVKSGFSIIEMILAMGLLTIISVLFVTLMLFSYRMANNASIKSDDSFISSGAVAEKYVESPAGTPIPDSEIIISTPGGNIIISGSKFEEEAGNQKYDAFIRN